MMMKVINEKWLWNFGLDKPLPRPPHKGGSWGRKILYRGNKKNENITSLALSLVGRAEREDLTEP